MALSDNQKQVLNIARENGGIVTKKALVERFRYYNNGEKYVGEILSRMVKQGLLIRDSPGVFKIGPGKKDGKRSSAAFVVAQEELFL